MKYVLIGYGRMGQTIHRLAEERGHHLLGYSDSDQWSDSFFDQAQQADVAIEFTQPESAYQNIKFCLDNNIKVITGTTGWLEKKGEIETFCRENGGTFFFASNFSIGVNIFFRLNQYLARVMNEFEEYTPEMREIHHIHKKDAPSGTAITLAEDLLEEIRRLRKWENEASQAKGILPIISEREGEVPGTHTVSYRSDIDKITVSHEAFGREGFALGAVKVAEWILSKSGVLTMDDYLKL